MPDLCARVMASQLPPIQPVAPDDVWWAPGGTAWTGTVTERPLFRLVGGASWHERAVGNLRPDTENGPAWIQALHEGLTRR